MERRVAELHAAAVKEKALRVFALVGAVYPGEWKHSVVEAAFNDIFELAFHARRLVEGCGLKKHVFSGIDKFLVAFSVPPEHPVETNYLFALNGLTHAEAFVFGWIHADHRKQFVASEENLMPGYVVVTSSQFPTPRVLSLYGVVDISLNELIPLIRARFPDYRV